MNLIALDYSSACTSEIDILVGDHDNIKQQMLAQQIELWCSIESIPASFPGKSIFFFMSMFRKSPSDTLCTRINMKMSWNIFLWFLLLGYCPRAFRSVTTQKELWECCWKNSRRRLAPQVVSSESVWREIFKSEMFISSDVEKEQIVKKISTVFSILANAIKSLFRGI